MLHKKTKTIIIMVCVILLVGLFVGFSGLLGFGFQDIRLSKYDAELLSIKLPPNTVVVEKHSYLGKLNGSGNGMQFLSTVLIKSDLQENEIFEWYENKCDIARVETNVFKHTHLERTKIEFYSLDEGGEYTNYYLLSIYNYPKQNFFDSIDIRGH